MKKSCCLVAITIFASALIINLQYQNHGGAGTPESQASNMSLSISSMALAQEPGGTSPAEAPVACKDLCVQKFKKCTQGCNSGGSDPKTCMTDCKQQDVQCREACTSGTTKGE